MKQHLFYRKENKMTRKHNWVKPEYYSFTEKSCNDCEYFNKKHGGGCNLPRELWKTDKLNNIKKKVK